MPLFCPERAKQAIKNFLPVLGEFKGSWSYRPGANIASPGATKKEAGAITGLFLKV